MENSQESKVEEKVKAESKKEIKPEPAGKKEEYKKDEDSESSLNESIFSQESLYKLGVGQGVQKEIAKMSEEDFQRYETFRSSNFPKSAIKKLIATIIGQAVNPNIVIGVSGLSKVFIGEMVEEAKKVQRENDETGPLLPSHIHEAYRRLYRKMPNVKRYPKAPW